MLNCQSRTVLRAFTRIHRWLPVVVVLAAALGGCGGGGGGAAVSGGGVTAGSAASGSTSPTLDVTITGSVGDGPVTGATVTVYDVHGAVLGTMVSDSAAKYSRIVKVKGSQYPLRLVASGGIDLVTGHAPDFKMVSVMLRTSDRVANINPFSTLIVNTAERMSGGLTGANVSRARKIVLGQLGFGLDTSAVPDPVTTRITTGNVAHIVKASEALGELVRRTRDLIAATGRPVSGSGVVSALAADMVDGFVDGLGASGTDTTISAVANVVSAQVLVESMSNSLRVGGVIASNVIDQSIKSTQPGVSNTQLSGNVRINNQMIRQAGVALKAVQVLDSSSAVKTIVQKVAGLSANSAASSVARVLPVGTTSTLSSASGKVASAARADITQINQAAFAQADTGTTTASSATTGTGGSTGSTVSTGSTGTGPATTGSFSVSWTAPVARSDGSALSLSAIGGYRIYYGNKRGSYPNSTNITNGTARSATVTNLASGTYYLVMTTYDSSGLESGFSPEVVKNVP